MYRHLRAVLICLLPIALLAGCESAPASAGQSVIHEAVTGPGMPQALGPYSHAIRAGDFLFISGQVGVDQETGVAGADFEAQARLTLENLSRVLNGAGSGTEHVVRTTVFLSDTAQFAAMNTIYGEYFQTRPPARSTAIVQLPRGLLISIDAIATAPQ